MLRLPDRAAGALSDPRRKTSCRHSSLSLVRQRIYALALGYEDLNDHDELQSDPALQSAVGAVSWKLSAFCQLRLAVQILRIIDEDFLLQAGVVDPLAE